MASGSAISARSSTPGRTDRRFPAERRQYASQFHEAVVDGAAGQSERIGAGIEMRAETHGTTNDRADDQRGEKHEGRDNDAVDGGEKHRVSQQSHAAGFN